MDTFIYAIRDKSTGKLRSDLFHNGRSKKYWDRKSAAEQVIENYADYKWYHYKLNDPEQAAEIKENFEVVTFKLTEVK